MHPGSDKLLELLKHVFIGLLEVPVVTGPCSGTLSGLGYPYGRETLETVFWAVKRTLQGWALHWLTWEQGGEALRKEHGLL